MGFIIRGFIWDIPILILLMCFFGALNYNLGESWEVQELRISGCGQVLGLRTCVRTASSSSPFPCC